ncbi:MAG: cation:proton antiporter [Nitrospinae bacterium]|nr:cation:proton antiporter [Nitrospinota bacterium]
MPEIGYLWDLVIVLGSAVVVATVLRRVGVPSIAGFILSGALVGPTALRLVDDTHQVEVLAEVGIVLLLFGIGLELSLGHLRRIWKAILLGGSIQVAATVACTAAVAVWFGLGTGPAVFLGCVVAVSSTAVVLRGLSTRGELDSPHGRLAVGILVFQDLCVVPMLLAVPILAGHQSSTREIALAAVTGLAILAGVLFAASRVVPYLLAFVAKTRERELFVLTVFLGCFGIAWGLSLAGISLALGAFLAGLIVAGSEFRHQAMSDLIPVREVFASVFFVSVGMLLDVPDVIEHFAPILGLLGLILVGKFAIMLGMGLILRMPLRVAILSAATLCQIGEFSFVLLNAASGTGLLGAALSHNLLVAIILSMLFTPMVIAFGPHLALGADRVPWLNRILGAEPPGFDAHEPHSDHVIVAGYGRAGREVCQAARTAGFSCIAVDVNVDNVRAAKAAGDLAVYGDVTQMEVLEELGCRNARLVVVTINDTRATELAVRTIRRTAPDTPVIARTLYDIDEDSLKAAGATRVITAEATTSAEIVSTCLTELGSTESEA